jgi:hypothetical protein
MSDRLQLLWKICRQSRSSRLDYPVVRQSFGFNGLGPEALLGLLRVNLWIDRNNRRAHLPA